MRDIKSYLDNLDKYGSPVVAKFDGGWHCYVDLNTKNNHISCKVSSDYFKDSPLDAIKQCHEILMEFVKKHSF